LQYYITNGTSAVDQVRTVDEAELFRAAESRAGALFGFDFKIHVRSIPADEAECEARLPDAMKGEAKETKADDGKGKK
jgi:hypothetical protein